jgi:TolB-like protein
VKNIPYLVRAFRVRPASAPADSAAAAAAEGVDASAKSSGTQFAAARPRFRRGRLWLWVAGPVLLLALVLSGAAWHLYAAKPSVNIDAEITNRRATAVLAFIDKRGSASGSTLGEDMADTIAGHLVRDGVRVIGRGATVRQDLSAPDFERIGREQGVRFVLAGRVTRASARVLVDTYLTEIESGAVYRLHEAAFAGDEDAVKSNYSGAVRTALRSWRRVARGFRAMETAQLTPSRSVGTSSTAATRRKSSRAHGRVSSSPPPRIQDPSRRRRASA